MPCCAIKVCRNYKGRLKTNKQVTYHRIPNDPIMRSRWVDIIRKSREEDVWKPTNTSVICSDHFRKKDMYFVEQRRRLLKKAIPSKALFISSLKSDESENSDEKEELPSKALLTSSVQSHQSENSYKNEEPPNKVLFSSSLESDDKEASDEGKEVLRKKSLASVKESSADGFPRDVQPTTSAMNDDDNAVDCSDLDSIFDTPKKSKLKNELRKKNILQKKHTLIIQSLRRKNYRLMKIVASLKKIIETLQKERYIDTDTENVLDPCIPSLK